MVTSAARPPLHFQNSILPPLARMSGWNTVNDRKRSNQLEYKSLLYDLSLRRVEEHIILALIASEQ